MNEHANPAAPAQKTFREKAYDVYLKFYCFMRYKVLFPPVTNGKTLRRMEQNREAYRGIEGFDAMCDFLRAHRRERPCTAWAYPWARQIMDEAHVPVYTDDAGQKYVLCGEKRMYFPASMSEQEIAEYYASVQLVEQDARSPHCYLDGDFDVPQGAVVADLGVAEGNFALTVVDRVKKLYLFEPTPAWVACLHRTFAPWPDKVVFVPKFIGAKTEGDFVTYDDYFGAMPESERPDFIKADIEGAEMDFLRGAQKCLTAQPHARVAIALYHRPEDPVQIPAQLREYGFTGTPVPGYRLMYMWKQHPYFQSAMLRAQKGC